jgi:hypothetical protein
VQIRTLDEVVPDLVPVIEPDVFVKMDVQGFEDRVIRGGRKTLSVARAVLLEVLIDQLYVGQATFRDLFILLDELGFSFVGTFHQNCDPATGRVVYLDAVFLKS